MSTHGEYPHARRPVDVSRDAFHDPSLDAMLDARVDGSALRRVRDVLPVTDAAVSNTQREAAWARLSAQLHDRTRVPYTDDVKPPIELVRHDEVGGPSPTDSARDPASSSVPDPDRAWARPSRPGRARWLAAASLVVAAGSGWTWANAPVVHTVAPGAAPQRVALADGSAAWLAPGSEVTVARRFGWPAALAPRERLVRLDGEAYFEVQRDGRRFVVEANGVRVQVLGTRFSVRGARAAVPARVEVSEGRVAVFDGGHREELTGGEGITVFNAGFRRHVVTPERVATWRSGGLAALDEPLGAVLTELGRRYGVEIVTDAAVDTSPTVSLFYADAPSLDVVLGDLCTAQGLGFTKTSRGYRIVAP